MTHTTMTQHTDTEVSTTHHITEAHMPTHQDTTHHILQPTGDIHHITDGEMYEASEVRRPYTMSLHDV